MKKYILPILLFLAASGLAAFYGLCHAAGWRQYTSILSGSFPTDITDLSAGVTYIVAYLGAILFAPLLALTGIFLVIFHAKICSAARSLGRATTACR